MSVRVQKISKSFKTDLDAAMMYYSVLCLINNITLTERQLQLVAYTAVRGTISSINAKEGFAKTFDSSVATVNNMIGELKNIGLIKKINNKYKVPPHIVPDFQKKDLILQITLKKDHVSTTTDHTKG